MHSRKLRYPEGNGFMSAKYILPFWFLFVAIPNYVWAQNVAAELPNIALIPIVGDRSVSAEQLNFLTGKFAAELMTTKSFRVLDRSKMDFILQEQGFQQSGACNSSECQVQMGQLLGVDAIVAGNLVRFGGKYAFRADYIDVSLGQVLYTSEVDKSGELEDVYVALCKNAAEALARNVHGGADSQTKPIGLLVPEQEKSSREALELSKSDVGNNGHRKSMSLKRKIALALWGSGIAGGGVGYYYDREVSHNGEDYERAFAAHNYNDAKSAYDDGKSAETNRSVALGASIGTVVVGLVLWFWPEGK